MVELGEQVVDLVGRFRVGRRGGSGDCDRANTRSTTCRRRCSAGGRSESWSTPGRFPRARERVARRSSGVAGRSGTRPGLGGGHVRAPVRRTSAALVRCRALAGPSDHQLPGVWAAVLSASNAASSRCWRRRLGSWLASAATEPISSSRSSSVAARMAPSWWARMRNTSRSQSASSNRNSRSAAAIWSGMTISWTVLARVSRRWRRSNGVSCQLLMTPWSLQRLHCHRIGVPGCGPEHDHPAPAAAVGWAAPARQRAFPRGSGVTGCGRPDDVAQVLGQSACRAWRVRGQVEEVVQIGDQHVARTVATTRADELACSSRSAGGAAQAGVGEPVGGGAGLDDLPGEGQAGRRWRRRAAGR